MEQLYRQNIEKCSELTPQAQDPTRHWIYDCFQKKMYFRVVEVYRTQARQNWLYTFGRTRSGTKKTWTKDSLHIRRLAVDLVALNCSYVDIERIALQYGIYRPPNLVALGDLGHYQMDRAKLRGTTITPAARLKGLKRRLATTKSLETKRLIQAEIERLEERLERRTI